MSNCSFLWMSGQRKWKRIQWRLGRMLNESKSIYISFDAVWGLLAWNVLPFAIFLYFFNVYLTHIGGIQKPKFTAGYKRLHIVHIQWTSWSPPVPLFDLVLVQSWFNLHNLLRTGFLFHRHESRHRVTTFSLPRLCFSQNNSGGLHRLFLTHDRSILASILKIFCSFSDT